MTTSQHSPTRQRGMRGADRPARSFAVAVRTPRFRRCRASRSACPHIPRSRVGLSSRVGLRSRNRIAARRGISLLEVLFAIFVLGVGLLGLMALVPVGGIQIGDAGRADRATACGKAAMSEMKIRRLLDPHVWSNSNGTPVVEHPLAPSGTFHFLTAAGGDANLSAPIPPFAIDPLFVAKNGSSTQSRIFASDNGVTFTVPRITLFPDVLNSAGGVVTSNASQRLLLPDSVFTWRDDLAFNIESASLLDPALDETARPTLQNPTLGYSQQIAGDYSWLVTVSPALSEDGLPAHDRRLFTVSVVVFYKRDFVLNTDPLDDTPSSERLTTVAFPGAGSGIGGGDCTLTYTPSAANPYETDYLKVRPGQWIMLIGSYPVGGGATQVVARWYRVVARGDEYQNTAATNDVDVTLAGPDWNTSTLGLTGFAGIYDGVVGVFEKTIELDHGSLWTDPHE